MTSHRKTRERTTALPLHQGNAEYGYEVMSAAPLPRGVRPSCSGRYPGWRKRRFPFPNE
jgi:hypothetical protein